MVGGLIVLLFSVRNKLAERYEKWLKEYPEIKNCPLNMISFLTSEKLLDEEKVKRFLENENGSCGICR